jgi:hypothetical protein
MKPFNFNLIVENHSLKNLREIKAASGSDRENIIKSVDDKLQAYFDKLVPTSGNSQFLEGEMIRAINRIIFRNFNDGDYFYQGYGAETVGPAMSFLVNHREIPIEVRRQIIDVEREAIGSLDKGYEDYIYQIAAIILNYIDSKNGEFTPSTADLWDYDSEYEAFEEEEDEEDDYYEDEEEDEEDEEDMYESISEALTKTQEKYKEDYVKKFKGNKKNFVKLYGPEAEQVMYGRAVNLAKEKSKKKGKEKLKELVSAVLSTPPKKVEEIAVIPATSLEVPYLSAEEVIKLIGKKDMASIGDKFMYANNEMEVRLLPDNSLIAVSIKDPNTSIPILFQQDIDAQKIKEAVKTALKNPKLADRNNDGELSSWEKKVGAAIEKNMSQNEIKSVSAMDFEDDDDDEFYQGDWGSSDQAIMNQSIHRDLNEPTEFPGLTQTLSAVEDAVDFYWEDWEEYQTEAGREDLIRDAFQSYMIAYFPDFFRDMQAFLAPIDENNNDNMMENYTNEDIDLGHTDNEPHMIKGELYQIGKYAMDLYAIMEELEEVGGEFDLPAWWQSKITTAKNMISGAKHYLEFELREPEIDAAVDAMTDEEPHMGEPEFELEEGLPPGYFKSKYGIGKKKMTKEEIVNETFKSFVQKMSPKLGKSYATNLAGAIAGAKLKGAGKGPTAKQKARMKK